MSFVKIVRCGRNMWATNETPAMRPSRSFRIASSSPVSSIPLRTRLLLSISPEDHSSLVTGRRGRFRTPAACIFQRPRCDRRRRPHIVRMSKLIVWHDGGCPLCRKEISVMRRLDRRGAIEFVDVTRTQASACPIDSTTMLARFHASEDGKLLSGAAAFAAMWRAIPLLRPLGLAARAPWVLAAFERIYMRFLRMRPRLQRVFVARGRR